MVQQGLTVQVTALLSSHRRILRSAFVAFCKKFGIAANSKFALSTSVQRDLSGSPPENNGSATEALPGSGSLGLQGFDSVARQTSHWRYSLHISAYVCGCHGCHFIVLFFQLHRTFKVEM